MLINTHGIIACYIYKHISINKGGSLDKIHFIYGNIKPDIDKELRAKSHYYEDSIFFIVDRIQRLSELNLTQKAFSVELGVVCHFLADSFCAFHQPVNKNKNILCHFFYELSVHFTLKRMMTNKKFLLSNLTQTAQIIDFKKLIIHLHQEYNHYSVSPEKDILFALRCAGLIIAKIEFEHRKKLQGEYTERVCA
jgi:hypothetical protein